MKKQSIFSLAFAVLIVLTMSAIEPVLAGGPLFVTGSGNPIRWSNKEVKGGPLSTNTVDAQGRVIYRVDGGGLGPLSNAEATALVDRIFRLYTEIPTSTIEFVNGGPILDPRNGNPIDITDDNIGLILGRTSTFQNPIVFDADGSIFGGGDVLGVFGPIRFSSSIGGVQTQQEGFVALNGRAVNTFGKVAFLGVFTHEFGHFAGPLDHSQIYGRIASGDVGMDGFSAAQRYDVFTPFLETVYPFIYPAPSGSQLATAGYRSSGGFIASLCFDDVVAMSSLYPTPGYLPTDAGSQFGGISGSVVIRNSNGDIPITGINVIARRISLGQYPPSPNLQIFNGSIPVDRDGVPINPDGRNDLDPLITSASIVSGAIDGKGGFRMVGLPPGDYLISLEGIGPDFLGGSGVGPRDGTSNLQLTILNPENFNGDKESGDPAIDNPKDFTPVKVTAGAITGNINFVLNGIGGSVGSMNESEPNDVKNKSQRTPTQTVITGTTALNDTAKVMIDYGQSQFQGVQDLYRIDLKNAASLVVSLEAANINNDIDVFVFTNGIKKKVSINSSFIVDLSISQLGSELVATRRLNPGTYIIGVAAATNSSTPYKLTILEQK